MSFSELVMKLRPRASLLPLLPRERALFPLFGKEGKGEISAVTVYFHIPEKISLYKRGKL
jgi:hypothetical protein